MSDLLQKIAAVKGPVTRLLKLARYVDSILVDPNGDPIVHESYDYADFATIDTTYRRYIVINDLHSADAASGAYGGSRWLVNPLASTPEEKIVLDSGPLWFATYAAYTSAITPSDHPGLRVRIGNIGKGLPVLVNKYNSTAAAYRLIPENGVCTLFLGIYGTLTSPTQTINTGVSSDTYDIGSPFIPGGLIVGRDLLTFAAHFRKNGTSGVNCTHAVYLGTNNSTSDSAILADSTATASDDHDVYAAVDVSIGSTTALITNAGSNLGVGKAALMRLERTTAINFTNDMYISAHCIGKSINDTTNLLFLSVTWRTLE